jgi:uncharacterized cupin superfamily protein
MPVNEASFGDTPFGRKVESEGWFVLNLADSVAVRTGDKGGAIYPIEGETDFPDFGVNVHVVWPGQPSALYHAENAQEGFLVLAGSCTLIVEEKERPLRQWDYFHCPAGTHHIFIGASEGPCAILMIGARRGNNELHYPVSNVAERYGASVVQETSSGAEAYADWPDLELFRLPWPVE